MTQKNVNGKNFSNVIDFLRDDKCDSFGQLTDIR